MDRNDRSQSTGMSVHIRRNTHVEECFGRSLASEGWPARTQTDCWGIRTNENEGLDCRSLSPTPTVPRWTGCFSMKGPRSRGGGTDVKQELVLLKQQRNARGVHDAEDLLPPPIRQPAYRNQSHSAHVERRVDR